METTRNSTVLRSAKEYLLITLGILLYTVAWSVFLTPNNMIGGGVTGISAILQYATGIRMGYSYFVINLVLLATSFLVIGPAFGAKTIYAIVLASIGLNVFQTVIPQSIIQDFGLSNGKLMCAIIGGMMSGVGIGMAISQGGSTGGTDIVALMITKYRNISPGRLLLTMNVVIILSSLLFPSFTADGAKIPFVEKFITAVYGVIIVSVDGHVVDLYLAGSRQSVQLFILSRRHAEIADRIANGLHRGVTVLEGEGWYTKTPAKVLLVITRKTELNLLLRTVKTIDPSAFLSISSVTGVYGQGFDSFKGKEASSQDELPSGTERNSEKV